MRILTFLLLLAMIPLFSKDYCVLDHAIVSIYAVDSKTGKILIDQNSDLSLIPSSCIKIATTAAALHLLGENHRFETHLEYDGAINHNILQGSLYIRGGGDPCLGSDRIDGALPWKKQIETWADAIQKLGVRRIKGKVIGDASKWEKALAAPSWNWEDLGNYYGAGACALSFHENSYSIIFKPGSHVGQDAAILRTDPPLFSHRFQNEVKTGPKGSGDRACIYGSEYSSTQFIRGTIPAAVKEFTIKGAIPDPPTYCATLLIEELQKRGITIEKQNLELQGNRVVFYTTNSPTVKEIVHWTNRMSINLYAEHLLKRMGEVIFNEGSTASGIKAVINFWRSQNLDLGGFNMVDGSGLSRNNLMTTKQLVGMLLQIKKSDCFSAFFESFPQREGPMRTKSGSMSLVRGHAGYTGDIVFAILINQCPNPQLMNEKIHLFFSHLSDESTNNQPDDH